MDFAKGTHTLVLNIQNLVNSGFANFSAPS